MFEDLINKINAIEKTLSLLLDLHMQQTNSLTTYNQVSRYLGKTTRTIHNYIKDSKLVINEHYYVNDNGKTIFISKAILKFKHNPVEVKNNEKIGTPASRVMHPIASKILSGVA